MKVEIDKSNLIYCSVCKNWFPKKHEHNIIEKSISEIENPKTVNDIEDDIWYWNETMNDICNIVNENEPSYHTLQTLLDYLKIDGWIEDYNKKRNFSQDLDKDNNDLKKFVDLLNLCGVKSIFKSLNIGYNELTQEYVIRSYEVLDNEILKDRINIKIRD